MRTFVNIKVNDRIKVSDCCGTYIMKVYAISNIFNNIDGVKGKLFHMFCVDYPQIDNELFIPIKNMGDKEFIKDDLFLGNTTYSLI